MEKKSIFLSNGHWNKTKSTDQKDTDQSLTKSEIRELVRKLHRECLRVHQSIAYSSETVKDPVVIFCVSVYST